MTALTAFDNELGLYQGWLKPQLAAAADGSYVWVLGFDLTTQKEYFAFGDYIEVATHLDLTGVAFLTAQVYIKQPATLLNRLDMSTGLEILGASSSTIVAVNGTGGAGGTCQVTTAAKHHLVDGDIIHIQGVLGSVNINNSLPTVASPNTNVSWTVGVTDATNFYIKNFSASGTYISGGSIGLQERLYFPAGFTNDDVGRTILISGSTTSTNNGNYVILGLQTQPGLTKPVLAWVQRPTSTPLVYDNKGSNSSLTATGEGARWKISLMVADDSALKERARVVQKYTQGGFYRTDLKANVRQHAGDRAFTIRLTLVQAEVNDLYSLPAAP